MSDAKKLMEEPEKFFGVIKQRISELGTEAERVAAASGVLGRGGFNLIPLLAQSAEETKKFTGTIERLGGTVTEHEAHMGMKFGQLQTIVEAAWTGIQKKFSEPFLEYVSKHFDELVAKVEKYAAVIRNNVVAAYGILKPAVMGAWDMFKGLGEAIDSTVGPAFHRLVPIIQIISEMLGSLFEVIGRVLSGIGEIVHGAADAMGITQNPGSSYNAGSMDKGGGGGGNINVTANFAAVDPDAASTQIVTKIRPILLEAKQKQEKFIKDVSHNQKVTSALRNGR